MEKGKKFKRKNKKLADKSEILFGENVKTRK